MIPTFTYYESIESTNLAIRNEMKKGCPEGTVISAGEQTEGRGRRGHSWFSPAKASISTSIALYPKNLPLSSVQRLTILAAMAVCSAIEELCKIPVQIKWPNDILLDEKKVCGILTELFLEQEEPHVVVGIGINLHSSDFPEEISLKATSIETQLQKNGQKLSVNADVLIQEVWNRFAGLYETFCLSGEISFILQSYQAHLINLGREVVAEKNKQEIHGIAKGVTETGALILKCDEGNVVIEAGESFLRGKNGYI